MSDVTVGNEDLARLRSAMEPRGHAGTAEIRQAVEGTLSLVYSRLRLAILNAIPHEHAAVLAIFGEQRRIPSREHAETSIAYVTILSLAGEAMHVVLAGITGAGIAQAAASAAQVRYKCRHVSKIILVGIAAGQPDLHDAEKDVRLGDIVVGNRVIQYDHVKVVDDHVECRGTGLPPGDAELMVNVDLLRAYQELSGEGAPERPWTKYVQLGSAMVAGARRPLPQQDPNTPLRDYARGLERPRPDDEPSIHVGTIGSASTLLKSAVRRDGIAGEHGTIAYEMEGAGLAIAAAASGVGYLMVRGICDYGDNRKDDAWQRYSSVCAAAFARAILEMI